MQFDSFLQVGHLSKDCPRDKAGADDYEEYYEDYGAHPNKQSGDGGDGGGVASMVCHHCQQTGHTRRNCPQADEKKVKPGDYSNVTCFHCKVREHWLQHLGGLFLYFVVAPEFRC